jgi:dolichol-phosphate mannosyltransferase
MSLSHSPNKIDLSIVAPARNEEGNIPKLLQHVAQAFLNSGINFELIIVEDRSKDRTLEVAIEGMQQYEWLRVLRIRNDSFQHCGKSNALGQGIAAARGEFVALIDADGQNDALDLLKMLRQLQESDCDMVHGDRSGHRRDNWTRRLNSIAASLLRRVILNDGIRDSACGLLVMTSRLAKSLPLHFAGIHRFLPCYARIAGFVVIQLPVAHHARVAGKSKYGFHNRLVPALIDLMILCWMRSRFRLHHSEEINFESRRPIVTTNPSPSTVGIEYDQLEKG